MFLCWKLPIFFHFGDAPMILHCMVHYLLAMHGAPSCCILWCHLLVLDDALSSYIRWCLHLLVLGGTLSSLTWWCPIVLDCMVCHLLAVLGTLSFCIKWCHHCLVLDGVLSIYLFCYWMNFCWKFKDVLLNVFHFVHYSLVNLHIQVKIQAN